MINIAVTFFVNHVGFLPQHPKYFVIVNPPSEEFTISNDVWYHTPVFKGKLVKVSQDLGDAWIGDFSEITEPALYEIKCGNHRSRPIPVHESVYDYPLRVLFNYYPSQRCGDSDTGWHAPCHLQDAKRADTGEQINLVGGWHQSCDLRKWITGTPYGLLGLSQLGLIKNPKWDNNNLISSEIQWGNRYFHNMIRPDGGLMDSVVSPLGWGARTVYPNDPPTCASFVMIVGQVMAAKYLKDKEPEHSTACLETAKKIWNYMTGPDCPKKPYHPENMPIGHEWLADCFAPHYYGSAMERGDALYAALKLAEITKDDAYLEKAIGYAADLLKLQVKVEDENDPASGCFHIGPDNNDLISFGHCTTFGTVFGALGLAELAILKPEHPDVEKWKKAVRLIAEQKAKGAENNPWGLIPSYWGSDKPENGRKGGSARYRYFFNYLSKNGGEIKVGPNGDIAGSALFMIRAWKLFGDYRYLTTAQRQVDWIFGCNPHDASTVEGIGLNQPVHYMNGGEFFPPTPQIPGAVMTGIIGNDKDEPDNFGNNCSTEYDIPSSGPLIWLLSELSSLKI